MFWQGKWFGNTRFWRKLSHKDAIKMVWADFMPILTPRLVTIIFLRKFSKKLSHKIAIKMSKGHFSVYLHWNFQVSKVSKVSKVSRDFLKKSRSLVRLLKCETLPTLVQSHKLIARFRDFPSHFTTLANLETNRQTGLPSDKLRSASKGPHRT